MKISILIGLCMALVLLSGTAAADWNVTWTPVKESIIDKEYIITVQNMQTVKRDVNISSFFAETDFDISELADVNFYEWKLIPYTYTANHYTYIDHNDYNSINGTWNNWTEQVYDYTETIESEKLDWKACKSQLFKETGTTKEDNYGFINIPAYGSKPKDDGTYNGTKVFKLTFRTPVVYDGSYGSFGKVALLLNGEEHHPYWNTSWSTRKEVILTGHHSPTSLDNPTEDGYIYKPGYVRYNTTDITSGVNSGADNIIRGYIEWDISSLPPNIVIDKVSLQYHGHTNAVDCHVHEMMNTRPSTSANQATYDEIGEGTIYANVTGFPIVGHTQEIDLGSNAISDLQSSITNGWFAVGIQADDEVTLSQITEIYSEEYTLANPKPTLCIEYSLTDYQLLLNVTYETGMQADFDDLRFTNDTHEIDTWLESKVDSSYALVWVEFPTTPMNGINQTYYRYYGNAGTPNNWDGNATFPFFDDFIGTSLDSGKWTSSGSVSVSSSEMTLSGIGYVESISTYQDQIVKYKVKANNGAGYSFAGFGKYDTQYDGVGTYWDLSQKLWLTRKDNSDTTAAVAINYNAYNIFEGRWKSGETKYFLDNAPVADTTHTTNVPVDAQHARIYSTGARSITADWILVSKYIANPPTYTFADTQYYTDSIHYNASSPYNHTIDSVGAIAVNRTITASDDINWTGAAASNDCQLVVTEYNLSNKTVANFSIYTSSLDWLQVMNLTPSESYILRFANGTLVEDHDADANGTINFTTDLAPNDYQIVSGDPSVNIALHSSYPAGDLQTNYTGIVKLNYIVESNFPVNYSSLAFLWGMNHTPTSDMHSYLKVPANSIAADGIYRAHNRNTTPYLSWEGNSTITDGNVWQWNGGDNDSFWIAKQSINATHTWINVSGETTNMFPSMFYLGRNAMYAAPKTGFEINKGQGIIMKIWDLEQFRGRSNDYYISLFFDTGLEATPSGNIELWYCNDSFDPDTHDPKDYCDYKESWNGTRWTTHRDYQPHANVSFCEPLTISADISSCCCPPTEVNYLYLYSNTVSSKSYILNATNSDPGICNLTFAQTNTMWTFDEVSKTSTPVAYTPSIFQLFTRDYTNMDFQLYIANDQDVWGHSGIDNKSVGVSDVPPTHTRFNYFWWDNTTDYNMTNLYTEDFYVNVTYGFDPDNGGSLNHTLSLYTSGGSFVATINDTLSGNQTDEDIFFAIDEYVGNYQFQIVSTDNEGSTSTSWSPVFALSRGTDEEIPLNLFIVLMVLMFGSLFYIYHAETYVSKIVTSLITTWMSFMLASMIVSGTVVLNYAELSSADAFVYGSHSFQIASLSHFFMFTGVVSAIFMLTFAVKLVIDTYLDLQEKRKAEDEWDGVEEQ